MQRDYSPSKELPGTVIGAIVCMGINAFVGLFLGLAVMETSPGWGLYGLIQCALWTTFAIGCARRSQAARTGALALSGFAIFMSLISLSIQVGTTLVVFICLLTKSAREAFDIR